MPSVCRAKASYKKSLGLLELTDSHLEWTQDGKKAPSIRVARVEFFALFCSREGAPTVRLKLVLINDNNGFQFTFTSPGQGVAFNEREKFKAEITSIISSNKENPKSQPPVSALSMSSVAPITSTHTPKSQFSQPKHSVSRATSIMTESRASPIIPGNDPATEFRLRKTVLMNNPELAALHRELVIGAQISEGEFWEGREHLLLAEAAVEKQRKGKSGQLVDPRPETVEGGEVKIRITPQLVHDIFDEYPVVEKAFNDNVPRKLSKEEFWKRYFQSKLFNSHRASVRSSATQHVVKDDSIFDKYLEKVDDGIEPRRQRSTGFGRLVDLGSTQEDHGETGNEKDITMQAGKQRAAMPLIRKFNEHSERLLNSALGDEPAAKRRKTDFEPYMDITLDDLEGPESSAGIILEMKDSQRYFETAAGSDARKEQQKNLDIKAIIFQSTADLQPWESDLSQFRVDRKAGDAALLAMTQNVSSRLEIKSQKNDIPENIFRQMTTCQTAANEFLRQYWTAIYPPVIDTQLLNAPPPSQRTAKATKMIGYLSKTYEKVQAIVQAARMQNIDPSRVETAMKPVLNAVDRAMIFHRTKTGARG